MKKNILGLDLGTNSIGWSLIKLDFDNKKGEIKGLGSRIIPMDQNQLTNFESGNTVPATAQRTSYRGTRRLYQRAALRRERLHRVLNILGFLPAHYRQQIDFEKKAGQFKKEVKLNYKKNTDGKYEFIFMNSFNEMVNDFKTKGKEIKMPYDWTIYYLRKKALHEKISKEELAWIILNFNQKRGYYQLRGDELEKTEEKNEKYYQLTIKDVKKTEDKNAKGTWYEVSFEEIDDIYRRQSKESIFNWIGTKKEFIITEKVNKDGSVKISFRAPKEDDWGLIKKKTEQELEQYIGNDHKNKTVGTFIYETLLHKPNQKIRGKLIKTIERKYYKQELEAILEKQTEFHPELQDKTLYLKSINELYRHNEGHKNNIKSEDFKHLFIEDIIFYQRPLKSQKSNIAGCQYEYRFYTKINNETGKEEQKKEPLKVTSKSHPLFQELRLWQWLQNLKIYEKEKIIDGKVHIDYDVTNELLPTEEDVVVLFDFLKEKKEIDLKGFLKYFSDKKLISKQKKDNFTHRWNYPEDKTYPMCPTHASFVSRLKKVKDFDFNILTTETEQHLWHIIYSVKDPVEYKTALKTFANRYNIDEQSFIDAFIKYPPFENKYASYSLKAIKKLLPLMRMGKYWDENNIDKKTQERIDKIISGEYDEKIKNRVREKAFHLNDVNDFKGLPLWLAAYIVYDRYSEVSDITKWQTPDNITRYLKHFKQHSLRNPIVEQVVLETLRTVRDIWQHYGQGQENFFDEIHIELGRELKNPADKRKDIAKRNAENERTNKRIRALLQELINDGAKPYSPSHQEILKIYEEGVFNNSPSEYKNIKLDEIEEIRKSKSPSKKDIQKYKLWLEQKYISPYTGETIPLSDLFSEKYQIEHIIPQSRFFDDSFNNKVICERAVNELKDNSTAYEFIKNKGGSIVELGNGKKVKVFEWKKYEQHCLTYFKKNKIKLKNLLREEIPEDFTQRQLNDSRYISKLVKNLLSKIVREDGEQEATSKNLLPLTGKITNRLKHDWGLDDKWNQLVLPRFKRLNELTKSQNYTYKNEQGIEVPTVPDDLKSGFNKKRIDHRHHALDALVIACCTRDHVNYINSLNSQRKNYSLVSKLRKLEEIEKNGEKRQVAKEFLKPWTSFPVDALNALEKTITSFKQNIRVINKATNHYWKYEKQPDGMYKKKLVKQTKGDNWAIRKPLHTPLPYGEKKYSFSVLEIAKNVGKREFIFDSSIRKKVEEKFIQFGSVGKTEKYLKKNPLIDEKGQEIKFCVFNIPQVRYRKRKPISDLANRGQGGIKKTEDAIKFINKVSDLNIRNSLLQHLKENDYDIDKAFSIEGIEAFNKKRKIPVYKLPIAEASSEKYQLGNKKEINKKKFGEAESGTNLYFAIYWNEDKQKREFETVPLNEAIAHQKLVAHLPKEKRTPILEKNTLIKKGKEIPVQFLFSLSPGDLVYVPTDEEQENPHLVNFKNLTKEQVNRIYKMVSSTEKECHFIPNNNSSEIIKNENGTNSKNERMQDFFNGNTVFEKNKPAMIKNICWKLKVDRLGNIEQVIKGN